MLDIQRIRDNPEQIKIAASNKKSPIDIQAITNLDSRRRDIIKDVEVLKNLRNTRTQEIALLKKDKKDASTLIDEMKQVSDKIEDLDNEQKSTEEKLNDLLIRIPNVPHSSVPHGESAEDNVVLSEWGEEPVYNFKLKDHNELGTSLDIIDFT